MRVDRRRRGIRLPLIRAAILLAICSLALHAQSEPAAVPVSDSGVDLDRRLRYSATGLALPNVPIEADLSLKAEGVRHWTTQAGEHRVLLDRGVELAIGSYRFSADRAAVMITPSPRVGVDARQVAVYFDTVRTIGGHGPIQQQSPRLLVTAVLVGKVSLEGASVKGEAADDDALMIAAERRIDRYHRALAERTAPVPDGPPVIPPQQFVDRWARRNEVRGEQSPDLPPGVEAALDPQKLGKELVEKFEEPPPVLVGPGVDPPPIVPPDRPDRPDRGDRADSKKDDAQVDFHAGRVVYQKGDPESVVLLLGDIQLMYVDRTTGRRATLTADKGVIFLSPDGGEQAAGATTLASGDVQGVYLEDNVVISDGEYTLRGPRVFYDFANERAVVLEAVFYTWDIKRQVPIYVRANQLRQHSQKQWSATQARLTTSEFYEPHFSIGVEKLTITENDDPDARARYHAKAEGITMNKGRTPVFWWPAFSADATEAPLQRISGGYSTDRGATIETRWDMFGLLNLDKPDGVRAAVLLDGYTSRGPGIGVESDYDVGNAFGKFDGYYLHDSGEDEPSGRHAVDPDNPNRGRVRWQHRHILPDNWEVTAEFGWVSDPTFLEEWFTDESRAEKEYETLLYLKKQVDDSAFTFLAKYDLLDFVPQTDLMQTRGNIDRGGRPDIGYTTDKFPELTYHRIATPLLDNRLTWYSENRASVMALNLPTDEPETRGFNRAESLARFGIREFRSFNTALEARGYNDDTIIRGDSRQELALPLLTGPVVVTPYAVGRVTWYDQDFESYHGEEDSLRLWGGLGVRASTSFARNYDAVHSDLLNVHRIRHIIEPSVNVFFSESSIVQDDLPVYDYEVESLAEGFTTKFGLRNTLQTQRGGEGNWRSVDLLRVESHFVISSQDTARESPVARFFDFRPELNLAGDHMFHEVAYQLSDAIALIGNVNYSFESDEVERWNAGFTLDHTPRLTSYVAVRRIEAMDSTILQYGFDYILTPKWHVGFSQSFDLEDGRNRDISVTLTRRMPRWIMLIGFDIDTIGDVQSFGIAVAPEGFGGPGGLDRNPFLQDIER